MAREQGARRSLAVRLSLYKVSTQNASKFTKRKRTAWLNEMLAIHHDHGLPDDPRQTFNLFAPPDTRVKMPAKVIELREVL